MELRFIEIDETGNVSVDGVLPAIVRSVCEMTTSVYQKSGFVRPWVARISECDGSLVGSCAFKSPPVSGRVEIAYFTFPGFEGRGIATGMARELVRVARAESPDVTIVAQTLPEENASTAILQKLGFSQVGAVEHPEDGTVWQWELS